MSCPTVAQPADPPDPGGQQVGGRSSSPSLGRSLPRLGLLEACGLLPPPLGLQAGALTQPGGKLVL